MPDTPRPWTPPAGMVERVARAIARSRLGVDWLVIEGVNDSPEDLWSEYSAEATDALTATPLAEMVGLLQVIVECASAGVGQLGIRGHQAVDDARRLLATMRGEGKS